MLCIQKRSKQKFCRGIFVLLWLLWASSGWAKDGTIDIVAFNDTHSQLAPLSTKFYGVEMRVGGFPALAEFLRSERLDAPDLMLVLTGDISYGPMYRYFSGEPEYGILSELGTTVGTLGNHEFDYGADKLKELMRHVNFPMLESNLEFSDPELAALFPKTFIAENRGLKVGFFGLITPRLALSSNPGEKVSVERDLTAVARRCVAQLKSRGADVVVALTHIGTDADLSLAGKVSGIHAILGGHSHTLMPTKTVVRRSDGWETLVGQAASYTQYAGRLVLSVKDGRTDVENSSWRTSLLLPLDEKSALSDPSVGQAWEKALDFVGRLDADLGKPIGELKVAADATSKVARGGECPLANFIADAYRWRLSTDIAAINGGNVRGDRVYPAGPISYKTLMEIQPYAGKLTTVFLTGRQLWTLAEIGASALREGSAYDAEVRVPTGGFLHYSGMRVEIDPSRAPMKIDDAGKLLAAGERVLSVQVEKDGRWTAPDPEKIYSVAAASWTAGGGDKTFVMKNAAKEVSEFIDVNVVADYILHLGGAVEPKTEGRILIK